MADRPASSPAGPKAGIAPATHVRYQVLGFACALAVVTYIQRLGFSSGLPEILNSLHYDPQQGGNLISAFLVAYGLFQVPWGVLGDRLGGRTVLSVQVLGWSMLTGAVALTVLLPADGAAQFSFLIALRFLFGAFQAGGFPVLGRVIADWMPVTERGFSQGAVWMVSRLGGAFVPFLFVWVFRRSGGWTVPFLVIAGLGVLWCAAFWPWFRNRPEEKSGVNDAERALIAAGRPATPSRPTSPTWSALAGSTSVWSLCLMYGCTGFSGNFFTGLLNTYLRNQRGLGPEESAQLASLPLAAGAVACLLGGAASDYVIRRTGNRRWGRCGVGMAGLGLAAAATAAIPQGDGTWLLAVLLATAFFGNDLSMGPAWASCADIGERAAGTLSGAMNMVGALAGAAGAELAGRLFKAGRTDLVFEIYAAVYVLAALSWLGVDATKRLADSRQAAAG